MGTRIAIISIIVDNLDATTKINELLHQSAAYIVGRMGIPYRDKGVSVISVVLDAPLDYISSLSGKLGMIQGISVKTVYAKQ